VKFVERLLRPKAHARFGPVAPERPVAPADFRAAAFPAAGPQPWLDRPDAAAAIERKLERGEISAAEAALARDWVRDGCVSLERHFDAARLDAAWAAYERAVEQHAVTPDQAPSEADPLPGRTLNAHFGVPEIEAMLRERSIVELVSMLLGAEALPFQTIMGHKGSEQRAHSDAIHMTTYPLGYLAAAWIAFEDISPDGGPLVYYPGSHRLPYVFSHDVGITPEEFRERGYMPYHERYEPRVAALIAEHGLEPRYFMPAKGDVLLWHANLLHGGSPRARPSSSRRALVCHYFARGCVTYHDLAAAPSHLYASRR
jgi:ectoine hydroxylase-related dioxygenase (phytanoyl-CoA dioxygenase family)